MSLLPDAEAFKQLANGTRRGAWPTLARGGLAALAVPYGLVVSARNAAYDRGLLRVTAAPVPVISVGNLTLGGTGKTPLVAWLSRVLGRRGRRVTILSRGYGVEAGTQSDEAAELGLLLPGVPHLANRDRVAGAVAAAASGADVVVLDDGFQHRRLARDLEIVAVDATDPFGCGHLFPRGLLREPLAGLARADAVVITRATSVDAQRRADIRARLESACRGRAPSVWAEAAHRPVGLHRLSGGELPLDWLVGKRVVGFAGIGNPGAFQASVQRLAPGLVGFRAFADHHRYSPADLADLAAWSASLRADVAVTTLKDLVKIPAELWPGGALVAVEIAMELLSGSRELESLLEPWAGPSTPPGQPAGRPTE